MKNEEWFEPGRYMEMCECVTVQMTCKQNRGPARKGINTRGGCAMQGIASCFAVHIDGVDGWWRMHLRQEKM